MYEKNEQKDYTHIIIIIHEFGLLHICFGPIWSFRRRLPDVQSPLGLNQK